MTGDQMQPTVPLRARIEHRRRDLHKSALIYGIATAVAAGEVATLPHSITIAMAAAGALICLGLTGRCLYLARTCTSCLAILDKHPGMEYLVALRAAFGPDEQDEQA